VIIPKAKLGQLWWAAYEPDEIEQIAPCAERELLFLDLATEYVRHIEIKYSNPSTIQAYCSPVTKHLLPFFAFGDPETRKRPRRAIDVDGFLVDEFVQRKKDEREDLAELAELLASGVTYDDLDDEADTDRKLLMRRYGQMHPKSGKHSLSSRGLTNNGIRRCLDRLWSILSLANLNHEPPAQGRDTTSWLGPDELELVMRAARELDAEASRGDYGNIGREDAMIAMALTGMRVGEFCAADAVHLSAKANMLIVPRFKTDAGARTIDLVPLVGERLLARVERLGLGPNDPLFATAAGTRRDRHSVRSRLLAPVLARAKELAEPGQRSALDQITCHSFRRTFATYLYWAGLSQRYIMSQIGHSSADLTLEVYAQQVPRDLDPRVRAWLGLPDGWQPMRAGAQSSSSCSSPTPSPAGTRRRPPPAPSPPSPSPSSSSSPPPPP
jgi:integrase